MFLPFLATDLASRSAARSAEVDGPASATGASRIGGGSSQTGGAPLVLTRVSGSSVFVAHASPQAVANGARAGLSLGEARARCPELLALPHDAAADARTLEHLAVWAQRFSPLVRSEPPDVLLLDVSGVERLFRGEANIVRMAVAGLAALRIRARAAIADTIGGAWALAHAAAETTFVAPPRQMTPCVVGLPTTALRLEPATVETLDALGVRSIGDLLMLPRATLPARFGEGLVLRLRQLLGETPEWIDPPPQAPVFAARMAFGPSDQFDVILAALERVLGKLCERLIAGGVAARRLLAVVYFEQREPAVLWIGLSRPSREPRHLRGLLVARIETVDLSVAATGLMVQATETAVWRSAQRDLFEPADRPDAESAAELIDRLANHLGGAVARAELVDDHQPEKAYRYVPLVGRSDPPKRPQAEPPTPPAPRNDKNGDGQGDSTGIILSSPPLRPANVRAADAFDRRHDLPAAPNGPRPLTLLARPQPLQVLALVPDGPPTWFRWREREFVVAEAAGPQRLETGWWRRQDVRRDYYRVTVAGGQRFWIYRDLQTRAWYLHGSFE